MAEASTNYSTDELIQMMDSGQITGEEFDKLYATQELATKSPLDVEPEVLDYAYDNDMMPEHEYAAAREYHDAPTKFYAKDIAKGAGIGIAKFAKSFEGLVGEVYNWFAPEDQQYEHGTIEDKPMSTAGQITSVGTQIASGWMATGGVGAGVKAGVKTLGIAKTMPKTAKFMETILPMWMRGAATDVVAFDPYEGRLADAIDEIGLDEKSDLAKLYVQYLATDKLNDPMEERLKTAVEGLLLGSAIDGIGAVVGKVFKLAKGRMLQKHHGSIHDVRAELREHEKLGPILKEAEKELDDEYEQTLLAYQAEAEAKKLEKESLKEGEDVLKGYEKESTVQVKDTPEETIRAMQILDDMVDEADGARLLDLSNENVLKNVEGLPAGKSIVGSVLERSGKLIDEARGGKLKVRVLKNGNVSTYRVSDATTGVRANKWGKKLADLFGTDPAKINSAFKNVHNMTKVLPEQIRFIKEYFSNYAEHVSVLAKKIANQGGSDDEMIRVLMHIQTLEEMQAEFLGIGSHVGRALHQLGVKTGKKAIDFTGMSAEQWRAMIKNDPAKAKDIITKFGKAQDPESMMRMARVLNRTGWQEATEFAQMNALSGWRTHVRNIQSQTAMLMNESVLRSIVGIGRGIAKADTREFTAVAKMWAGMGRGFVNSMRPGSWHNILKIPVYALTTTFFDNPKMVEKALADPKMGSVWKVLLSGEPMLDKVTKVVYKQGKKVGTGVFRSNFERLKRPIKRLSFDMLAAADEGFKQVTHEGFLRAEAVDAVIKASPKLKGAGFHTAVDHLIANPTKELIDSALQRARAMTFQEDLPVGGMASRINSALNTSGPGAMLARLGGFLFFKTPVNILRATQRLTPFAALAQKRVRANLAAGGVKAQMEMARQASGALMLGGTAWLWADGGVTGNHPDDQRASLIQAGIPEYSIKVGDEWWSYKHIEPFATLVGAMVNLMEASKYINEDEELELLSGQAFMELASAIYDPIVQNSYLKGFLELSKALDPQSDTTMANKMAGIGELFIPATGFLNNVGDTSADDWYRQTRSLSDRLERKLNLFMKDERLIKRNTITGERLKKPGTWMAAGSVVRMSDDPIDQEVARLGLTVRGWKEDLKVQGVNLSLDKDQQERLWDIYEESGVKEQLLNSINDPDYQVENDIIKEKWLRSIINGYRRMAVYTFLDEQEGDYSAATEFNQKLEEWAEVLGNERPFRQYKTKVQDNIKEFIK